MTRRTPEQEIAWLTGKIQAIESEINAAPRITVAVANRAAKGIRMERSRARLIAKLKGNAQP